MTALFDVKTRPMIQINHTADKHHTQGMNIWLNFEISSDSEENWINQIPYIIFS
jgi:hypothetical protein